MPVYYGQQPAKVCPALDVTLYIYIYLNDKEHTSTQQILQEVSKLN